MAAISSAAVVTSRLPARRAPRSCSGSLRVSDFGHDLVFPGCQFGGEKKFAEAEPLLLSGYDGLIEASVDEPSIINTAFSLTISRFFPQDAGAWIVRLYEDRGKPEQATEWKRRLQALNPASTHSSRGRNHEPAKPIEYQPSKWTSGMLSQSDSTGRWGKPDAISDLAKNMISADGS